MCGCVFLAQLLSLAASCAPNALWEALNSAAGACWAQVLAGHIIHEPRSRCDFILLKFSLAEVHLSQWLREFDACTKLCPLLFHLDFTVLQAACKDRRTGGQEDRRTGGQEDRRTRGQEDKRRGSEEIAEFPFSKMAPKIVAWDMFCIAAPSGPSGPSGARYKTRLESRIKGLHPILFISGSGDA